MIEKNVPATPSMASSFMQLAGCVGCIYMFVLCTCATPCSAEHRLCMCSTMVGAYSANDEKCTFKNGETASRKRPFHRLQTERGHSTVDCTGCSLGGQCNIAGHGALRKLVVSTAKSSICLRSFVGKPTK
ncbi:uncharacterized protein [Triticum aestivum]|uniref:uncharacterized protein isoform X2 n=1 Tax=Triticum aestivum TaxID=4565 RepID=UPI001D028D91|nr:uncharacterized protein LOC123069726 isoform X2 [Triticum aestivum]